MRENNKTMDAVTGGGKIRAKRCHKGLKLLISRYQIRDRGENLVIDQTFME